MRINQNTMAMNAHRNLSGTQNSLGKSLEKLSSGFRINRAAAMGDGLVEQREAIAHRAFGGTGDHGHVLTG